MGDVATTLFILPGAAAGALVRLVMWAFRIPPSPMLAMMVAPSSKKEEKGNGEVKASGGTNIGTG